MISNSNIIYLSYIQYYIQLILTYIEIFTQYYIQLIRTYYIEIFIMLYNLN